LFNKAIDLALEKQKVSSNTDFVTLFEESIKSLDPNVRLAGYFSSQLRDQIKLTDDNDAVMSVVRKETADAFDRTYQILRQRIDKFGVAQPNIQKLSASERILIELPGVKEPERVRKLLQGTAQLEFWLSYDAAEAMPYLEEVNKYIASIGGVEEETEEVAEVVEDSTAVETESSLLDSLTENKEIIKLLLEDEIAIKYYFVRGGACSSLRGDKELDQALRMWAENDILN
jgi:SecD/SecF fusion protein